MNGWRQATAVLLVVAAVCVAIAAVPLFFSSGTQWPVVLAVAVLGGLALVGIASRQAPRLDLPARTAVAGVTAFLVGLGLFVLFAGFATGTYDERPRPGWLEALALVAVALIGLGVVGVLVSASGRLRSHRQQQHVGPSR